VNDRSDFATSDLCDLHEGDASVAFRVLPPVFRAAAATNGWAGIVVDVRARRG